MTTEPTPTGYAQLTKASATGFLNRVAAYAAQNPDVIAATPRPSEQRGETPEEAAARRQAATERRVAAWRRFMTTEKIREANLLPDEEHGFSPDVCDQVRQAFSGHPVVWIQGDPGVGKTALAIAIGNLYANAGQVPYLAEFATAYDKAMLFGPHLADKEEFFTKATAADILILDDYGAKEPHPNALADVNALLDARRSNPRKVTVVTSNQDYAHYKNAALATRSPTLRILDRLNGYVVTYRGTSVR